MIQISAEIVTPEQSSAKQQLYTEQTVRFTLRKTHFVIITARNRHVSITLHGFHLPD